MYSLLPSISSETIYRCILNIHREDSKKIVDNLDLLIGVNNIAVKIEESSEYIKFHISCNSKKDLEVFYFKISSIANDNYIRRNKIEKKK